MFIERFSSRAIYFEIFPADGCIFRISIITLTLKFLDQLKNKFYIIETCNNLFIVESFDTIAPYPPCNTVFSLISQVQPVKFT